MRNFSTNLKIITNQKVNESPNRDESKMIIPVRCFTCGKVIGHLWDPYIKRVKNGEDPGKVLDELGVTKPCCRRMFISHLELIDEIILYELKLTPKVRKKEEV